MKNRLWGYMRPLLLGIIIAAVLLWGITITPAAASTATTYRHDEELTSALVVIPSAVEESRDPSTPSRKDFGRDEKKKELVLSLPFNVPSHWTSVDDKTPGITWQTPSSPNPSSGRRGTKGITPLDTRGIEGMISSVNEGFLLSSSPAKGRQGGDSIKFGIKNGQFVPGDPKADTWFVYGWFGSLSAIKQPYNVKYPEWGDRHDGIDFAGQEGIEITSASSGTVTFVGKKIGQTVEINAGNGYRVTYGHLQNIAVKKGQKIKPGDLIGHLGHTGTVNPHLHFEVDLIKKDVRRAINPVPLLRAEWGSIVIPAAEANRFYTDNQNPFSQPNFIW